MKKLIFSGKGTCILTKSEMKQARGGMIPEEYFRYVKAIFAGGSGDLAACNNKKCTKASDCGICATMTCNGVTEKHCM